MPIVAIDYVQIAAPRGWEHAHPLLLADLFGLTEIDEPPALRLRGGVWFEVGKRQLHVGVAEPFTPARKAAWRCARCPRSSTSSPDSSGPAVLWSSAIKRFRACGASISRSLE